MQARIPKKIRTARIEPAVAAPIVTMWFERLGDFVRGTAGTVGSGCRVVELEGIVVEFVSIGGLGEFGAGRMGVGTTADDVPAGVGALEASVDFATSEDVLLSAAVDDGINCVDELDAFVDVVDCVDFFDFVDVVDVLIWEGELAR